MERAEIWIHAKNYAAHEFYKSHLMIETRIIASDAQDNI